MIAINSTIEELVNGLNAAKDEIMSCIHGFLQQKVGSETSVFRMIINTNEVVQRKFTAALQIFFENNTLEISYGPNKINSKGVDYCQIHENLTKYAGLLFKSLTSHSHVPHNGRLVFLNLAEQNVKDLLSNAVSRALSSVQENATEAAQNITSQVIKVFTKKQTEEDSTLWSNATAQSITSMVTGTHNDGAVSEESPLLTNWWWTASTGVVIAVAAVYAVWRRYRNNSHNNNGAPEEVRSNELLLVVNRSLPNNQLDSATSSIHSSISLS